MIAAANFSSASWISSRRSKRILSLPKSVRPLHHPAVLAQPLATFDPPSANPAGNASVPQLVVVVFVGAQLCWSFTGRPAKPAIAGFASTHLSNILESCLFAPLTKITKGMLLAYTTMCRLEPSLPLSVGLGPISCPPGAWYRGAINAGPPPIDLVMFMQASQYGLVQLFPDTSGVPDIPPVRFTASWMAALMLAALGGAFCLVGVRAFQRARTTVNPITPAASTTLVVGRIYRMTRNPMYLGFALLLLALAMYLGKLSGFLLVPLFMAYLQHFQMLFALDHQLAT